MQHTLCNKVYQWRSMSVVFFGYSWLIHQLSSPLRYNDMTEILLTVALKHTPFFIKLFLHHAFNVTDFNKILLANQKLSSHGCRSLADILWYLHFYCHPTRKHVWKTCIRWTKEYESAKQISIWIGECSVVCRWVIYFSLLTDELYIYMSASEKWWNMDKLILQILESICLTTSKFWLYDMQFFMLSFDLINEFIRGAMCFLVCVCYFGLVVRHIDSSICKINLSIFHHFLLLVFWFMFLFLYLINATL
jgi:hypothetical protein